MTVREQFIIGVDLGGTNIATGAMPTDGTREIGMRMAPTHSEEGADAVADRIAMMVEDVIAQMYVYSAPFATRIEHRVALMTIGGVQARHRTVLGSVFAHQTIDDLFPGAFAPSATPLPPDAILS